MDIKVFYACISKLESEFGDFKLYKAHESTDLEKHQKISKIETWQETFKNIDDEVFIKACGNLLNKHKYNNIRIAHLMDEVIAIQGDVVTPEDIAWKEVTSSFRKFHPEYEHIEAADSYSEEVRPIVEYLGGFTNLSNKTSLELGFIEREFKKIYKANTIALLKKKNSSQVNYLGYNSTKMLEV